MSEGEVDEQAIKFTLEELRRLREHIDQRVKQLETVLKDPQTDVKTPPARAMVVPQPSVITRATAPDALNRMDELPWERAKSKKCYWVRGVDVPVEVRNLLRRNGNELVAGEYRYVILDNDNLLRFERNR
jgi:hypothetical protein